MKTESLFDYLYNESTDHKADGSREEKKWVLCLLYMLIRSQVRYERSQACQKRAVYDKATAICYEMIVVGIFFDDLPHEWMKTIFRSWQFRFI